MKKLLTIFFGALVFFVGNISFANADFSCQIKSSCSNSEYSILEMTNSTNAHAGLPGSGYPYSICCSGVSGLSNSCSGNETAVFARLSGSSNAHVRAATEGSYESGANACISASKGTLKVSYLENDCQGSGIAILSMSKFPTNSHIGGPDDYANKICVKYTPPPSGFMGSFGSKLANIALVFLGSTNDSTKVSSSETGSFSNAEPPAPAGTGPVIISRIRSFFNDEEQEPVASNEALAIEVVGLSGSENAEASRITLPIADAAAPGNSNLAAAAGLNDFPAVAGTGIMPKLFAGLAGFGLFFAGRRLYLKRA